MRVIAGSAGGIRLAVPKKGVRPTMDRVKAAIFSSLGDKVIGARVLDLFAGSGGLGIEALSRGAQSALFVDNDRQAIDSIERNLMTVKLEGKTRQHDVFDFLSTAESLGQYDLVFADPPYENMPSGQRYTAQVLGNSHLLGLLGPDGMLVLEKRPGEVVSEMAPWNLVRRKTYGATEVLFLGRGSSSDRLAADETSARERDSIRT